MNTEAMYFHKSTSAALFIHTETRIISLFPTDTHIGTNTQTLLRFHIFKFVIYLFSYSSLRPTCVLQSTLLLWNYIKSILQINLTSLVSASVVRRSNLTPLRWFEEELISFINLVSIKPLNFEHFSGLYCHRLTSVCHFVWH